MSAYGQTLYPTLLKEIHAGERKHRALRLLGTLRYLFLPLFFCWHRKMSRPFTRDGETYRVCLRCGVHRQFDLKEWKTKGDYYNPGERQNHSASKPRLQLVESGTRHDNAQIRCVSGRSGA
jgi:hypothetical protein